MQKIKVPSQSIQKMELPSKQDQAKRFLQCYTIPVSTFGLGGGALGVYLAKGEKSVDSVEGALFGLSFGLIARGIQIQAKLAPLCYPQGNDEEPSSMRMTIRPLNRSRQGKNYVYAGVIAGVTGAGRMLATKNPVLGTIGGAVAGSIAVATIVAFTR